MRFERRYQPWLAASKDTSRPVLTHVNLTIDEVDGERVGWLDATNSYVFVRVPVLELHADDTAGPILVAALKHAAKTGLTKSESADIACVPRRCETPDGYAWPRPDTGAFPDYARITSTNKGNEPVLEVGVNGDYLAMVQKATGARNGIGVTVGGVLRPLQVRAGGDDAAKAIVMPIRLPS